MWINRRFLVFSSTAAIATSLTVRDALACSCIWVDSPEEHLTYADVVFRGEVVCADVYLPAPEPGAWSHETMFTRFDVLDVFKSDMPLGGQIDVLHASGVDGGICGVGFRRGMTPLVLAARRESDSQLTTNYCLSPRFPERAYRRAMSVAGDSEQPPG
jgi:hypothetical protein